MENLAERYEVRLEDICEHLQSRDEDIQLRAAETAGKMLDEEKALKSIIIDHLINGGILPILVRILESDKWNLQFRAVKIVGQFAIAKLTVVAENNVIRKLVELLRSNTTVVAELSVVVLTIIAHEGSEKILENDAAEVLVEISKKDQPLSFLISIADLMHYLCLHVKTGDSQSEKILKMLPAIATFLSHDNPRIIKSTVDALRLLATNNDCTNRHEAVINAGCIPGLIGLLNSADDTVANNSLITTLAILNGIDSQKVHLISMFFENGVLSKCQQLFMSTESYIVKATASILGWIMMFENANHRQAVIDSGILSDICRLLRNGEDDIKERVANVFMTMMIKSTNEKLDYLTETVLKPFTVFLSSDDIPTLLNTLNGFKYLFQAAAEFSADVLKTFTDVIEEIKAGDRLNELSRHEDEDVAKLADHLLVTYF